MTNLLKIFTTDIKISPSIFETMKFCYIGKYLGYFAIFENSPNLLILILIREEIESWLR